ncbi:uncharacterized protein LOC128293131 [Gossypium arboreum]|uniref:uncharacterized protein LOC128293131 n=1 Tax=Gossypium arboreum TaxID=29729 RepID=UPI0022F15305|nr:uncharacterized protein LOC128293131 [Gossypium arboreum]
MEERKWPAGVLENLSQRSKSNEIASHLELRDHSEKVWPWTAVYSPKHGLILVVVGGLRIIMPSRDGSLKQLLLIQISSTQQCTSRTRKSQILVQGNRHGSMMNEQIRALSPKLR